MHVHVKLKKNDIVVYQKMGENTTKFVSKTRLIHIYFHDHTVFLFIRLHL